MSICSIDALSGLEKKPGVSEKANPPGFFKGFLGFSFLGGGDFMGFFGDF